MAATANFSDSTVMDYYMRRADRQTEHCVIHNHLDGENVCGNCAHYDWGRTMLVPVYDHAGRVNFREYAPCRRGAVEADAPDCVTLMGSNGCCQDFCDAFEASQDYLASREYDASLSETDREAWENYRRQ